MKLKTFPPIPKTRTNTLFLKLPNTLEHFKRKKYNIHHNVFQYIICEKTSQVLDLCNSIIEKKIFLVNPMTFGRISDSKLEHELSIFESRQLHWCDCLARDL